MPLFVERFVRQRTDSGLVDALNRFSVSHTVCSVRLKQRVQLAQVFDGQSVNLFVVGQPAGKRLAKPWREGVSQTGKPTVATISFDNEDSRGEVCEIRVSRGVRYLSSFVPERHHLPDADTLLLLLCDESAGEMQNDASSHRRHGRMVGARWIRIEEPASSQSAANLLTEIDVARQGLAIASDGSWKPSPWQRTTEGVLSSYGRRELLRLPVLSVPDRSTLRVEFEQAAGDGSLFVGLPYGNSCCFLLVNGPQRGG